MLVSESQHSLPNTLMRLCDELRSGKGLKLKARRTCMEQRTYTGRPCVIQKETDTVLNTQENTQSALIA
jgi:hypothetical protein